MTYQVKKIGDHDWQDDDFPGRAPKIMPGYEYRIKPEPAAPKWPRTTMVNRQINDAIANGPLELVSFGATETARRVINKAIEHECSTGALVPADKVREIETKARADEARKSMNPVAVIEAAWRHMKLGRLDPETIQIILLQAAK